ncbi:hypothetical protein SCYAM73S_00329 [Streptomyces cyaneofuscatus]
MAVVSGERMIRSLISPYGMVRWFVSWASVAWLAQVNPMTATRNRFAPQAPRKAAVFWLSRVCAAFASAWFRIRMLTPMTSAKRSAGAVPPAKPSSYFCATSMRFKLWLRTTGTMATVPTPSGSAPATACPKVPVVPPPFRPLSSAARCTAATPGAGADARAR